MSRRIYEIAKEIRADWKKVNYAAEPYLRAMEMLVDIKDHYYEDDAISVVLYFLASAQTWRGETAKRIKKELKELARC